VTGAAGIAARLNLRRAPHGWCGNCPACGYRDGFRLVEKAGRALWTCFSCQDRAALVEAVLGQRVGGPTGNNNQPAITGTAFTKTEQAMRLWNEAQPIQGSPAQHYLATRGVALPNGAALRYLPDARHPTGARAGCMLALVVDAAGRGQAVHRTYLAPGGTGKAALDPPRATLGPVGGAVVRLSELSGATRLVVAEGIETSLSAGLLASAPAWAALSAGNMARVPVPDTVQEVIIAADNDTGGQGQRAAWEAADAFLTLGKRVRVLMPDLAGDDCNDILRRRLSAEVANA